MIVKTVTRFTFGLIMLYGIYIALKADKGPGGGFAAGVIIALALILWILAFGKEKIITKLDQTKALALASLCGIIFLFTTFFAKHDVLKKFVILVDMAVAVMAGAGLFVIFLALILFTGAKEER